MKLNHIFEDIISGEIYIVDRGPYGKGQRYELWKRKPSERHPIKLKMGSDINKLKQQYPKAIIYDTGQ